MYIGMILKNFHVQAFCFVCACVYVLDVSSFSFLREFERSIRRDKYEKHVKLYWVEKSLAGRKLMLNGIICLYIRVRVGEGFTNVEPSWEEML